MDPAILDVYLLTRKIQIESRFEIKSVHFRKDFTALDGLFIFNVFWEQLGALGVYFRVYDDDSYFLLKIIPALNNDAVTIILQKSINREVKIIGNQLKLGEYKFSFQASLWYTFYLQLNKENIQLQIQTVLL